jgi:2-polyprenyl-3-methyl-5-hydroxy-6-metoxy-1,4-benzoquinol methylase
VTPPTASYSVWKGWMPAEFGICAEHERRYFEHEVGPWLSPSARVLEIGFGNGSFLGFVRSRGHDLQGVEADFELVERAKAAGFRAESDLTRIQPETVDLIAAFDVLEHVDPERVNAFIGQIASLLSTGGVAILRFPNGDSPFGRANQHGDVTHVNTIGSLKLKQLALQAQLEVVALKNVEVPRPTRGIRPLLKHAFGLVARGVIERVLGYAYYGGRRPLADNLVAILRKG